MDGSSFQGANCHGFVESASLVQRCVLDVVESLGCL